MTALRASQARVLNMFVLYGDMHDKQLIEYLHDAERQAGLKPMSDSGARSRRNELCTPNMDRLDELKIAVASEYDAGYQLSLLANAAPMEAREKQIDAKARERLRIEGFRSKLWDTGKRVVVDGREVTVWGIAR